eukprot:TRINITY_DN5382_c0_g1_i3.p1 TRINITY_DN5382_c0_g1~~TRINITY_DN5382_c0_g1_i3.p1  ORF type:complete len:100 (+),score=5.27 TRINITY_DN5382_c0_g1_i3:28-300(+)
MGLHGATASISPVSASFNHTSNSSLGSSLPAIGRTTTYSPPVNTRIPQRAQTTRTAADYADFVPPRDHRGSHSTNFSPLRSPFKHYRQHT